MIRPCAHSGLRLPAVRSTGLLLALGALSSSCIRSGFWGPDGGDARLLTTDASASRFDGRIGDASSAGDGRRPDAVAHSDAGAGDGRRPDAVAHSDAGAGDGAGPDAAVHGDAGAAGDAADSGDAAGSTDARSDGSCGSAISFVPPTDDDNAVVNRNWTEVNTAVTSDCAASALFDWDRSLVGYWSLDDGDGLTAVDDSTYRGDGQLIDMASAAWVDGVFGGALQFDGVDDHVDVPDHAGLDLTTAVTVEAWLYAHAVAPTPDWRTVVAKDNAADFECYGILVEGDQRVVSFYVNDGGVAWASAPLPVEQWTHVLGTYDVAAAAIAIYIDGELSSSGPLSASPVLTSDSPLVIGGNTAPGGSYAPYYFDGIVDEVRVWNRVLSPEEIKASYDARLNRLSRRLTGLPNGSYSYSALVTASDGVARSTEVRTIAISAAGGDAGAGPD
ncbi:MAG: LamG domain-containing protein [Deltaproteobacteria bacterium]|nr:LamG domain-containing protein [Deltaproteobacteria bacterium]